MTFEELLAIVRAEPAFETGLLLAGEVDPDDVRRQLSRWVASGKLVQWRRGLYSLAEPYRKEKPHPFLIANLLVRPSYVSLQSALSHYGLIPEYVPVTTSVTTARPGRRETPDGIFDFRHLKVDLFWGYSLLEVSGRLGAFVALPEKALLDLIYLVPGADSPAYLEELRLQNLAGLDLDRLERQAGRSGSPKLQRAVAVVRRLAATEAEEYEAL